MQCDGVGADLLDSAGDEMRVCALDIPGSKGFIQKVLEATKGGVVGASGATARLDVKRTTLQFRMQKLNITRPKQGRYFGACR